MKTANETSTRLPGYRSDEAQRELNKKDAVDNLKKAIAGYDTIQLERLCSIAGINPNTLISK